MYCLYWKHADEIVEHESFIDALFDYIECIDNKGLEIWWEDTEQREAYRVWIGSPDPDYEDAPY